ncbi:hypothetical protein ACIPVK_07950 [Paeniglutamicibacter sp. MACA_103]|uniref:hypothetical protein n=1 Tax=Paeniglutamicibacter sp. MACA_103 TaxID=3377337 RepID=UPI003895E685
MIIQLSFDVPPEIHAGLLSGEYIRHGGIVRNKLGQIVKPLIEVSVPSNAKTTLGNVAARSKNPGVIIAAAALVTVAVGTTAIIAARKWGGRPFMPECVERYNASLGAYLEAIEAGRLDTDIIDRLVADFDAVSACSDESSSITLDLNTKHGESLFNLVVGYTRQLAEANSIDLGELQELTSASAHDEVVHLRRLLEAQKKIFTEAA